MYLDGFSDVTEEPESPELHETKPRAPSFVKLQMDAEPTLPDLDGANDPPPLPSMLDLPSPNESPLKDPGTEKPPEQTTVVVPGPVPPPLLSGKDSRDCYGFRKSNNNITIERYEAWNGPYSNSMAKRKARWAEMLQESGLATEAPVVFPDNSSKMKRFVRKGIPSEYRGAAWFWYAGGHEHLNRNPGRYDRLVESALASPSNDDKEHIERDLHRTFPDNIHFKPEVAPQSGDMGTGSGSSNLKHDSRTFETQMIQSLRRVLYAFSLHNPKIGYTQSLNFITGLLLLFLPEEKAFWMLHIITSVYLPGTHEVSLEGANIDLWILMVLLRESMPTVYGKIASTGTGGRGKPPALGVHSRLPDITLGMTNWLMSVFIGTLPLETTLRVWDVFFYEGSKTFFRVSLAIFKASEKDLLAVSDPMEVFQVVQSVPKGLLDANALLEDCFVRKNRVGQGRIDELREARRAAVRQNTRQSLAISKDYLASATDDWSPRARMPIPGLERKWRHIKQHTFR